MYTTHNCTGNINALQKLLTREFIVSPYDPGSVPGEIKLILDAKSPDALTILLIKFHRFNRGDKSNYASSLIKKQYDNPFALFLKSLIQENPDNPQLIAEKIIELVKLSLNPGDKSEFLENVLYPIGQLVGHLFDYEDIEHKLREHKDSLDKIFPILLPELIQCFIDNRLIDQLRVFSGPFEFPLLALLLHPKLDLKSKELLSSVLSNNIMSLFNFSGELPVSIRNNLRNFDKKDYLDKLFSEIVNHQEFDPLHSFQFRGFTKTVLEIAILTLKSNDLLTKILDKVKQNQARAEALSAFFKNKKGLLILSKLRRAIEYFTELEKNDDAHKIYHKAELGRLESMMTQLELFLNTKVNAAET